MANSVWFDWKYKREVEVAAPSKICVNGVNRDALRYENRGPARNVYILLRQSGYSADSWDVRYPEKQNTPPMNRLKLYATDPSPPNMLKFGNGDGTLVTVGSSVSFAGCARTYENPVNT